MIENTVFVNGQSIDWQGIAEYLSGKPEIVHRSVFEGDRQGVLFIFKDATEAVFFKMRCG